MKCSGCQYYREYWCSLHRFSVKPDDEACSYMKDESNSEPNVFEEEEIPEAEETEGGICITVNEMEDKI